ncbi:GvpL/GvpF family gas vesicle protein [Dactylosporangium darangshiense]|uniref:GvpL/GvpF family gas vesicle protein n=1 Tax=Dactylosporangium darangshiense TaxID=579108 RepID=A0ABP8DDW5_9ACTN
MAEALWLHAVARDAGGLDGFPGIVGATVRTVATAGLVAVVSPVDPAEFGEEALRRNLEDLPWLEGVARAHHAVVAAAGERGAVVPATLATVYRDDAGVRAMLEQRRADLDAALDRISGHTEWGVKVYAGTEPIRAPAQEKPASAHPGTDYLRRRRAELSAGDERRRRAEHDAEQIHEALADSADAARRHPPQDRRLTGHAEPMVLNGAYLVSTDDSSRFADAVDELAQRHPGLRLELTGPWPPYSFASAEEAPAGEAPAR